MKRQIKLLSLTVALAIVATETYAQSLFGSPYGRYNSEFDMAVIRMVMMAMSIGTGFGLGWLMSPFGRHVRHLVLLAIAGLTILIATFNTGALGWSATWLVSIRGGPTFSTSQQPI